MIFEIWDFGLIANKTPLYHENLPLFIGLMIAVAAVSYLVGSINFGILISKMYGKDVRLGGSGNAGATNMTRQFGKKAGVLTFLGDSLKGAFLALGGILISGMLGGLIAGLFCIIGHAYPIYFKFKGGKGFSSMVAIMIVTDPIVFCVVGTIYLILLFGIKMVSFAAVMTMLIYPFILFSMHSHAAGFELLVAMACSFMVIFLHRKNIVRIFNHTEPRISFGKKKKKAEKNSTEQVENTNENEMNLEEKDDENSEK